MSIELNPVGVKCNMACPYCYEEPMREAGNFSATVGYDMEKMKAALLKENWRFSLFGGEPLLMPIKDMEEIFKFGFEKYGGNAVQTNGTLITEEHIRIFKQYKVGVGISMDGPGSLNDSRWMGTLEKTREATEKSQHAIERLCEEGIPPSLIFTLYRGNAVGPRLHALCDWLEDLDLLGVKHARAHLLEVESEKIREEMGLTDNETVAALLDLHNLERRLPSLRLDLFVDMVNLLTGRDGSTSCIWNACDPYTTRAVQGIDGQGEKANCGRTNKEGIDFVKANQEGFERQLILWMTPQEDGGCKDCRFFFACKGQCPGTAIDGDWRNRTEQCDIWFRTFSHIERELLGQDIIPLSQSPKLPQLHATMIAGWEKDKNLSIQQALQVMSGVPVDSIGNREHGDHWDAPDGYQHTDGAMVIHGDHGTTEMHGDSEHGDQPHGDSDAQ